MLNRDIFFKHIRGTLFSGVLNQHQVDGINADLDYWQNHHADGNPQHLAYILATDYWETQQTMQPIAERGGKAYLTRMYDIQGDRPAKARELGNLQPGDGAKYTGGKVQLTGRRNFRIQGRKLNLPLESQPELIYDIAISTAVLIDGMLDGDFTGRALSDYTDLAGNLDPINARRVVNGTDHAEEIAAIFRQFHKALQLGLQAAPDTPVQAPMVAAAPTPITEVLSPCNPDELREFQRWQAQQRLNADSKPGWQSKIVLNSVASLVSILLTYFGLNLPADQITSVVTSIAAAGFTLNTVFRLFFTKKPIRL